MKSFILASGRAQIGQCMLLKLPYKQRLITCMDKLTAHSYIAKCQSKYLKNLKENLNDSECIVLGDFAENNKFIVQDEIQGYH